jgi:hypothetical protein
VAEVAVEAILVVCAGGNSSGLRVLEMFDALVAEVENALVAMRSSVSRAERRVEAEAEEDGTAMAVDSDCAGQAGLWRSECSRALPQPPAPPAPVLPRPLREWSNYLQRVSTKEKKGPKAASSAAASASAAASSSSSAAGGGYGDHQAGIGRPQRPAAAAAAAALNAPPRRGRRPLEAAQPDPLLDADITTMLSDLGASEVMCGMRHSGNPLRERVTVMEHRPDGNSRFTRDRVPDQDRCAYSLLLSLYSSPLFSPTHSLLSFPTLALSP